MRIEYIYINSIDDFIRNYYVCIRSVEEWKKNHINLTKVVEIRCFDYGTYSKHLCQWITLNRQESVILNRFQWPGQIVPKKTRDMNIKILFDIRISFVSPYRVLWRKITFSH